MGAFANLEEARDYFKDDRFVTENGMTIEEMTDEYAVCRFVIEPRHRNAMGSVMGGAIFTLGDFAISVLGCNLHLPVVGMDGNIHFMAKAKGDTLYARATCLKNGRTTAVLQSEITDDTGRVVAFMTGTAFKV